MTSGPKSCSPEKCSDVGVPLGPADVLDVHEGGTDGGSFYLDPPGKWPCCLLRWRREGNRMGQVHWELRVAS